MMLPWHSHYTPSMFTCCSQMCSLCSHVICPSWVLILNVTLYYRLVDQGFISVNQLWFIHIWAIMGFQWMMMHGYVLGHITPQQHVLFSLWKQYNIVKACHSRELNWGPILAIWARGVYLCFLWFTSFYGVSSDCMFVDLDWTLQFAFMYNLCVLTKSIGNMVLSSVHS